MFTLTPIQLSYTIALVEQDLDKVVSVKRQLINEASTMENEIFECEYEKILDSQKKVEDVLRLMRGLRAEPTSRKGRP